MVSEIFKILSEEHENILKIADALEKESSSRHNGKEINQKFFKEAIEFIRNYADKFHHAKEEDILFKEFCKAADNGEVHCNPVQQMLIEHEIGREAVKKMINGLEENNKEKLTEGAKEYIELIREHIFKEDNILYPMADGALSNEIKNKMLKKFKEISEKRKKEVKEYTEFIKEIK